MAFKVYHDTIKGIRSTYGSGLAEIAFESGRIAHVSSGCGLRAFAHAFGTVGNAVGKGIFWTPDDIMPSVIAGFTPEGEPDASRFADIPEGGVGEFDPATETLTVLEEGAEE